MRGYVGEGEFTNDPLETFGGIGVVQIPDLQQLLRYICENGFEHHVAANLSNSAAAVHEATIALSRLGHALARRPGLRRNALPRARTRAQVGARPALANEVIAGSNS